ncbi:hypothetical protein [Sphingopyxis sp. QXT-31]|uniref:hypothetical protein n=1 Tax=Sphingopyxis sp. QXT-31 TaxID=1357916 RepID=UPI0012EBD9F8|nr:hypothetical protein [Sphingopyxis sp. QXT-31]
MGIFAAIAASPFGEALRQSQERRLVERRQAKGEPAFYVPADITLGEMPAPAKRERLN